ncbi:MAG: putative cytokinetic ring protein SteA [Nocardioides sp.]
MKFPSRQSSATSLPGITGTARVDRRTSAVVRRSRPGDIAVIDHLDLDRAHAEALVNAGVRAVVNASSFISGRYPNLGPDLLARAGVVLVDSAGTGILRSVQDGARIRLHEGTVYRGENALAQGQLLTPDDVAELMERARSGLATQLQSFTHNTTEFLRREQDLLLHGQGIPPLRTPLKGRPAVVVVRGYDYRDDLRRLRRFVREQHPVLIGVDAGADALVEVGLRPDVVVVGELGLGQGAVASDKGQSASDRVLRSARDVVLHTDRSGRAVGSDRLERLGVRPRRIGASGMTEDVALLLADSSGASLVIAVGTHSTLDEFLDRQRSGLASTFLTRLKIGSKLVDSKSVQQLYSGRIRLWHLALVLLSGLVALVVAIAATPVGADWWTTLRDALNDLLSWIQGLFS